MVHFAPDYLDLKESMVRCWKKIYLNELENKKQNSEELRVSTLPSTKMGWPLKLGAELDNHILLVTCQRGGAVTTDIAIVGTIGIIRRKDSNLLAKNGGIKRLGPKFIG